MNAVLIGSFFLFRGKSTSDITWEEFVRDYLNEGIVEKLEVEDKRFVRVITKPFSIEDVLAQVATMAQEAQV